MTGSGKSSTNNINTLPSGESSALGEALGADLPGFGEFGNLPGLNEMTDAAKQAAANLCNMIARNETVGKTTRDDIFKDHTTQTGKTQEEMASRKAENNLATSRFTEHAEARSDNLTEALSRGDMAAVQKFFAKLNAGGEAARRNAANPNNPNQPGATPGRLGANAAQANSKTNQAKTSAPPLFPKAPSDSRAANLTQPRLAQLGAKIAKLPEGDKKTEAQKLGEQLLRAAGAGGDHKAAEEILKKLAALGIKLKGEEKSKSLEERQELEEAQTETEGEGKVAREGTKEGQAPRRVARIFSNDLLKDGITCYGGGDQGEKGEVSDYAELMRTGLRIVCGGSATEYATRVATEGAVRGTYAEGDGEGDSAGGRGGRNSLDPVEVLGSESGLRFDVTITGASVAYTPDGRVIGAYQIYNPQGNPSVRRLSNKDLGILATLRRDRSMIFARASSGISGERGVYHAGMMC
ncbi:MAG TPA: hypothetical protein DF383_07805 [Deltaproteobacteria bacterium]|nr:hypothetical protein [Deltaproteobacteria bacterium]